MWDIRVSECTEFVLLRLPDFLFIFLVHVQWTCYFGILWWIHDPNTFPFTFRISNENGLSSLFCAVFSSHFHRSLLDSFKLNDSHVFFSHCFISVAQQTVSISIPSHNYSCARYCHFNEMNGDFNFDVHVESDITRKIANATRSGESTNNKKGLAPVKITSFFPNHFNWILQKLAFCVSII